MNTCLAFDFVNNSGLTAADIPEAGQAAAIQIMRMAQFPMPKLVKTGDKLKLVNMPPSFKNYELLVFPADAQLVEARPGVFAVNTAVADFQVVQQATQLQNEQSDNDAVEAARLINGLDDLDLDENDEFEKLFKNIDDTYTEASCLYDITDLRVKLETLNIKPRDKKHILALLADCEQSHRAQEGDEVKFDMLTHASMMKYMLMYPDIGAIMFRVDCFTAAVSKFGMKKPSPKRAAQIVEELRPWPTEIEIGAPDLTRLAEPTEAHEFRGSEILKLTGPAETQLAKSLKPQPVKTKPPTSQPPKLQPATPLLKPLPALTPVPVPVPGLTGTYISNAFSSQSHIFGQRDVDIDSDNSDGSDLDEDLEYDDFDDSPAAAAAGESAVSSLLPLLPVQSQVTKTVPLPSPFNAGFNPNQSKLDPNTLRDYIINYGEVDGDSDSDDDDRVGLDFTDSDEDSE